MLAKHSKMTSNEEEVGISCFEFLQGLVLILIELKLGER